MRALFDKKMGTVRWTFENAGPHSFKTLSLKRQSIAVLWLILLYSPLPSLNSAPTIPQCPHVPHGQTNFLIF